MIDVALKLLRTCNTIVQIFINNEEDFEVLRTGKHLPSVALLKLKGRYPIQE